MKRPQVGDNIRVSINLHGRISEIDKERTLVYWRRGKGVLIRATCKFFPLSDIIPAEKEDQNAGIRWRLQFYLEDAYGSLTDENKSMPEQRPRQPWTPYSA